MMDNNNLLELDLENVLDGTRELWDEIRGQRIFITGGTGFMGCWLLETLLWANARLRLGTQVVVLSRRPEFFRQKAPHLACDPALSFVTGDVRTFEDPAGTFSHMIHAAAESSAAADLRDPRLMLDTIVEGTHRTLDFAERAHVHKYLLTSSGAVYGQQPADMARIPEEYTGAPDPLDPRSAYGQGKRLAEDLCLLYAQRTRTEMKLARCFAFVGPYLPLEGSFAIGNFIRDALMGGPIVVQGDGTPRRSYLYAADLATWLWTILFQGKSGRPYNVGGVGSNSMRQVAELLSQVVSPKQEVVIRGTPVPGVPASRYVPDVGRAQSELGLREDVLLEAACRKTIAHLIAAQRS